MLRSFYCGAFFCFEFSVKKRAGKSYSLVFQVQFPGEFAVVDFKGFVVLVLPDFYIVHHKYVVAAFRKLSDFLPVGTKAVACVNFYRQAQKLFYLRNAAAHRSPCRLAVNVKYIIFRCQLERIGVIDVI